MYFVGVREVPVETTLHLPITHPHRPAPQSMGPWQTSVQSRVQTPLFTRLMQFVGWQHSAGTQSLSLMHACGSTGVVIMLGTVVKNGEVGAGDTVTGGVLEIHPHMMISPAINRKTSKPVLFLTIFPYILTGDDNFFGTNPVLVKEGPNNEKFHVNSGYSHWKL
jgi:hypothetical protein